MEEKYKIFLEFNFDASSDWKTYLQSFDPTPNASQIFNLKKKFYKKKIDPDFDVGFVPSRDFYSNNQSNQSSQSTSTNSNTNTNSNQNTTTNRNSNTNTSASSSSNSNANTNSSSNQGQPSQPQNLNKFLILYIIETLLFLYFVATSLFYDSLIYALYALVLRIIRTTWPVKFSKVYFSQLLQNETFYFLIYALIMNFLTSNSKLIVYLFPLIITAVIYISGFHRRNNTMFPAFFEGYMATLRSYQDRMLKMRQNSEILILPISIIGIFIGFNSFFLPIIYYQYLKMKLSVNVELGSTLTGLKNTIRSYRNTSTNSMIQKALDLVLKGADYLKA